MTNIDPIVDTHLAQGLRARAADLGDEDQFYEQVLATIAILPQRRWFLRWPATFSRRTSLLLVAAAALVLCGDTGVAHLATAYRRPSVVLFGPVSPALWGPPARTSPDGSVLHRVLWHGDGNGDPWGADLDPALEKITVDEVRAVVDDLAPALPR